MNYFLKISTQRYFGKVLSAIYMLKLVAKLNGTGLVVNKKKLHENAKREK